MRKKREENHRFAHIAHSAPVLGGGPPEQGPSGPSGHILDFIELFIWPENHGVPARTHRLRCLGNAVVPQIPELIGRQIMENGA